MAIISELTNRILDYLEYADYVGGGHDLPSLVSGLGERYAGLLGFQNVIDGLIKSGEIETFVEDVPGERLIIAPDGSQTREISHPQDALRLVGEALKRGNERNRFRSHFAIQDSIPMPSIWVDEEAYHLALHSPAFVAPPHNSIWWQSRRWFRADEIPINWIVDESQTPIALPWRITYPWDEHRLRTEMPVRATLTERACEFVTFPLTFSSRDLPGPITFVGRLPDDLWGNPYVDGIFVYGRVDPDDLVDGEKASTSVRMPHHGQTGVISTIDEADKQEPDVIIGIFPADDTTADFVGSVLTEARIGVSLRGSRGISITVSASRKEEAIDLLSKDSQQYNYRVVFA